MAEHSRWRWTELSLLPLPAAFLLLGLALLNNVLPDSVRSDQLRGTAVLLLLVLVAHFVLVWKLPSSDQLLLPITAALSALGLIIIARLDSDLAMRQLVWVTIGFLLLIGTVVFLPDVALLQSYKYTAALLGMLLLAATFVFGRDPTGSGARWWLGFGQLNFQPSELLKVLLVIFLAGYLEDKRELLSWSSSRLGGLKLPPLPYLGPLAVMWAISILLVVGQRDLGAALLFFGIFLSMLYVASSRAVYVWGGLVAFLAGAYVSYLAFAHVRLRAEVWLDPWSRSHDQGYQVVQGLVALASGGLLGSGLGQGHPDFVPVVTTDFIIAAIGEEMGLAGTLAVVALFMMLVYRGFRVALDARRGFSTLFATGLTAILGLQTIVILAGTTKLTPLTGITLPFISYGGSSIVTNFVIVGLLLRISSERGERRGT